MTMKNKIITGILATTIVASVGISAVPQERFYKDIPLPIETSRGLETRISYNSVTIPTRANLRLSESWLLGNKTLDFKSTEFQTTFIGAWANYMEDGEWKDIDPNFRRKGNNFVMDKAPFKVSIPLASTGIATFLNDNVYDLKNKETFDEPILIQTIQAIGITEVAGELETGDLGWGEATYIIYRQAYPNYDADLIYFVHEGVSPRLRKLIRFNSLEKAPSVDTEFSFKLSYDNLVYIQRLIDGEEIGWTRQSDITNYKGYFNVKLTGSRFVNKDVSRGNSMRTFTIWDSGEKEELINVNLSYLEEDDFILTKIIPSDFFLDAQFPVYTDTTTDFYPDTGTGSTTVDGTVERLYNNGEVFATIRGNAGTGEGDTYVGMSVYIQSHASDADEYRQFYRAVMLFDTSVIDTDDISVASLSLYSTDKANGLGDIDIHICASDPASNNILVFADYNIARWGATTLFGSMAYASWTDGASNEIELNGAGIAAINKTGITKFGARHKWDILNNTTGLTWAGGVSSMLGWNAADAGSNKPKLSVTHAPPTARRVIKVMD